MRELTDKEIDRIGGFPLGQGSTPPKRKAN